MINNGCSVSVTRKFEFDAAHRVLGHENKCKHLHGHRYSVLVTVEAPSLDGLGRVVDFSCLKTLIGEWIDANLDHNILLHAKDPLWPVWASEDGAEIFAGKNPYHMRELGNPTAENIAILIAKVSASLLPQELEVIKVRVHETPNCFADYFPPRRAR